MTGKTQNETMQVDTALVRELADLLKATDLSEIEVVDGEKRIRVARQLTMAGMPAVPTTLVPSAPAEAQMSTPAPGPVDATHHPGLVRSPMVGTAYTSAEPGKPAFVSVGSQVKEGDTLIIIEAMKVMNPIAAPRSGTVTHIFVQNETPVEFGEPLLVIE